MAGWLGEQTIFEFSPGEQYNSWLASNVYVSSITHSGNTVTVSGTIHLYARCNWTTSNPICYYGDPINATPTGGSEAELKGWTSTTAPDFYKDQDISSLNFTASFTVPATSTSATFSVYFKDTRRDDWINTTKSWTITFDPGYIAPTTPTITVSEITASGAKATWGTTSFGNPSTGTVTLSIVDQLGITTQVASKTTTGNTANTVTSLAPGRQYTFVAVANNGQLSSTGSTQFTTKSSNFDKTYCSVNGKTKKVNKMYCSINGKTKTVKKIYMSVNGKTKVAFDKDA